LSDFDVNTNDHIVLTGQTEIGSQYQIAVIDLSEYDAFDAADASGTPGGYLAYFQNLQRIKDFSGSTVDSLSFVGYFGNTGLYFFDDKIALTYHGADGDTSTVDSLYRMDIVFTGAVQPKAPTAIKPVGYYNNYYSANFAREKVNGYKKVVYPELYPDIDLEIGENYFGPVFYFIVKPGGDFSDIEFTVDGATALLGAGGTLSLAQSGYAENFSHPVLYQNDYAGVPVIIP
jgi:hypothetical protein